MGTLQDILREWKQAHSALTDLLLEKDTVTGSEIENIMATHPAAPSQMEAEPQVREVQAWVVSVLHQNIGSCHD